MDIEILVRQFLNATSSTLFVVLAALGLTIIFGMMRVINMAHGEFFMLGAYCMYVTTSIGANFWLGLVAAPVLVALFGIAIERTIVRRLYQRHDLSTLLATWGLSIVLQQVIRVGFGAQSRSVASPIQDSVTILGATFPAFHVIAMCLSLVVIVSVIVVFLRTDFGTQARATIQNPEIAAALGVNTSRMYLLAFGLGTGLAGAAGALMAPLVGVVPTMGTDLVVRSFLVVIAGGMGQLFGTLAGGVVIGGGESVITTVTNGTVAQISVLLIVILLMLVRPRGLLGR